MPNSLPNLAVALRKQLYPVRFTLDFLAHPGFEGDAFGETPAFGTPLIPSEPVLRLSECWRGQVAGGRLLRAGLGGRVEWASEAAKSKVHTVQFLVQVRQGQGVETGACGVQYGSGDDGGALRQAG